MRPHSRQRGASGRTDGRISSLQAFPADFDPFPREEFPEFVAAGFRELTAGSSPRLRDLPFASALRSSSPSGPSTASFASLAFASTPPLRTNCVSWRLNSRAAVRFPSPSFACPPPGVCGVFTEGSSPRLRDLPAASARRSSSPSGPSTASLASLAFASTPPRLTNATSCRLNSRAAVRFPSPSFAPPRPPAVASGPFISCSARSQYSMSRDSGRPSATHNSYARNLIRSRSLVMSSLSP
jgi:hypothetical protein